MTRDRSVALVLAACLCISGCGSSQPASSQPASAQPASAQPAGSVEPADSETATATASGCPALAGELRAHREHLDDHADELHSDYTPAVHALIAAGLPGACALFVALDAADEMTRLHASRVFEGVLNAQYGWSAGYPDSWSEDQVRQTLAQIEYDALQGSQAERHAGAERWRRWVESELSGGAVVHTAPQAQAAQEALDAVAPALRTCGEPVDIVVSFDAAGAVESVYGHASTRASYRTCLRRATTAIRVTTEDIAGYEIRYRPTS